MSRSQPLDTAASTGSLMLSVIAAVGQAEREGMLERQREGSRRQSARRPVQGAVCRPHADRQTEIIRLKDAGIRPTEIAARLGIGRASVYRVLGEQRDRNQRMAA